MCAVTVCGEMPRISPISLKLMPLASSCRISVSRADSGLLSGEPPGRGAPPAPPMRLRIARSTLRATTGLTGEPPARSRRMQETTSAAVESFRM